MKRLKYQLKNMRRDKLCILTFLLPIVFGLAIHLLSDRDVPSISENTFGILKDDLLTDTICWLETNGRVTVYEKREDLNAAIVDPATQIIGVLRSRDGIKTVRAGDELNMMAVIGDTLPLLYEKRNAVHQYPRTILPLERNNHLLKSLLTGITLVTAMFMGCTFNAMSIISEKEEGIVWIYEALPMTRMQFMIQKITLGFIGSSVSTVVTAAVCMRVKAQHILPLILLIIMSAFIAALTGLLIGHFSSGLMVGIVYIKIVMLLFLAPPILFYLLVPADSLVHIISYALPSSATFYALMDLMSGQQQNMSICLAVLSIHCAVGVLLYRVAKGRGMGFQI